MSEDEQTILPQGHRSDIETALDLVPAAKLAEDIAPRVEQLGEKFTGPGADLLPHVLAEAGLDVLQPFISDDATRYLEGTAWQRLRGFAAAVHKGLSFVGLTGTLEYNRSNRTFWNTWQIGLDQRPAAFSDLPLIATISEQSQPARSYLSRIFHDYDVRAHELSRSKLSGSILSDHSGTAIEGATPKWSLGRTHEAAHALTFEDMEPVGIWVPPGSVRWADLTVPWESLQLSWQALASGAGASIMAAALELLGGYLGFYAGDGSLLGARRFRVCRQVGPGAVYDVAGGSYAPASNGRFIYYEALTDFEDGVPGEVASVALLIGATPAEGIPAGRSWLTPDEINMPHEPIVRQYFALDMDLATRERIKILCSFQA